MDLKNKQKIFIAGHKGMVGSALYRKLSTTDNEIVVASRNDLDLCNQNDVKIFFNSYKFDEVYLAAAKVGGIYANNEFPAEFIYENLMIQNNIINSAFLSGVKKLLFLGSSCIYPKMANQPMKEDQLLSGKLEPTNEPYAISKIAGIKMCESYNRQYGDSHGVDYRSVMPTNLYGPGDNYHPTNSHVIPALIRRFYESVVNQSERITIWGSGNPSREFLHVDDMADASIFVMNLKNDVYKKNTSVMQSHINVGCGKDISIRDLAHNIASISGFNGDIVFDTSKQDGPPRKLMNSEKLFSLGWKPSIDLDRGLEITYKDYIKNLNTLRN